MAYFIIDGIFRKDSAKVLRVERDQMIGALVPDRPDQAFKRGRARPDPCGRDSRTRLPPWVCDGETLVRIRMKDSRFGNPVGGQPVHLLPREAIFLATPPQRAQPNTFHIVVECFSAQLRWSALRGRRRSL